MNVTRSAALRGVASAAAVLAATSPARSADKLADLVAAAKNEHDLPFIAGSDTFGGQPGVNALNDAFAKRFNLSGRLTLTPGPNMVTMAARVSTEYKANRTASTAMFMGPVSTFISLDRDGALERVDWAGIFPWVTREMVISQNGSGLLVRTGVNAIIYYPKALPPEKAPKRYEDLVDPKLDAAWAGKLAIAPYNDWLVDLVALWGHDRALDFIRKLVPLATGRVRYGDAETLVSGQFAIMGNDGSALEQKWQWQDKGVTLNVVPGSNPVIADYFQLGVPKNSPSPNLAKLFTGWLVSKEAQAITDKFGQQASHLVPGTRVYQYVHDNHINLWDPQKIYAFYSDPQTAQLYTEIGKLTQA